MFLIKINYHKIHFIYLS